MPTFGVEPNQQRYEGCAYAGMMRAKRGTNQSFCRIGRRGTVFLLVLVRVRRFELPQIVWKTIVLPLHYTCLAASGMPCSHVLLPGRDWVVPNTSTMERTAGNDPSQTERWQRWLIPYGVRSIQVVSTSRAGTGCFIVHRFVNRYRCLTTALFFGIGTLVEVTRIELA